MKKNIYVYSYSTEKRESSGLTRKYAIDAFNHEIGYIKCSVSKSTDSAEFSLVIEGNLAVCWTCKNIVCDSQKYSCFVSVVGREMFDISLVINKSRPGIVCSFPNSMRISEIRKVGNFLKSESLKVTINDEEIDFRIARDTSFVKMCESIFSILTIGIFRPKNYDFITGVSRSDLTEKEILHLLVINATIRMVFTGWDFSYG
jgi:hypothetical protein